VECLSPNLWIVKGYDELYLTLDSVKVWVKPLKVRIAWTDGELLRPVLWMSIIKSFHPTLCKSFTITGRWYSRGRAYIPTFIQALSIPCIGFSSKGLRQEHRMVLSIPCIGFMKILGRA